MLRRVQQRPVLWHIYRVTACTTTRIIVVPTYTTNAAIRSLCSAVGLTLSWLLLVNLAPSLHPSSFFGSNMHRQQFAFMHKWQVSPRHGFFRIFLSRLLFAHRRCPLLACRYGRMGGFKLSREDQRVSMTRDTVEFTDQRRIFDNSWVNIHVLERAPVIRGVQSCWSDVGERWKRGLAEAVWFFDGYKYPACPCTTWKEEQSTFKTRVFLWWRVFWIHLARPCRKTDMPLIQCCYFVYRPVSDCSLWCEYIHEVCRVCVWSCVCTRACFGNAIILGPK